MIPATILVVEDERVIASDICQTLAHLGYIVPKSVSTGQQAIDAAGQLLPELVLMDIKLKGDMDGVTAALEIRRRFAIPVVYLSSHSDDATLTRAARAQPDGYVIKPFNDRDLGIAVAMAIKKHAHRQEEGDTEAGATRAATPKLGTVQGARLASLGTRVAVMIHEINNPLSSVMANVEFCVEESERICAHLQKLDVTAANRLVFEGVMDGVCALEDALGDANEGARRIRLIVAALRGYGRVDEHGSGPLELAPVLEAAIKTTAHAMRSIVVSKEYGQTPLVEGDEGPLTQVFANLLTNAADAIRQRGTGVGAIRIRTRTAADGRAVIEVHDNGAGITPEILPRIFEPFFSTKAAAAGTGLGLSICRDILVSIGGDVAAQSGAGDGATFRVTLPAAASPVSKERARLRTRARASRADAIATNAERALKPWKLAPLFRSCEPSSFARADV